MSPSVVLLLIAVVAAGASLTHLSG